MLLAGTNIDDLATLESKLNDSFDMKDLGDASHILGMRIVRDEERRREHGASKQAFESARKEKHTQMIRLARMYSQ